jgi:hypothetical protein
MHSEFIIFRWDGVIEVIGSGRLAVLVTGVVAAITIALWIAATGPRNRRR